MPRNVVDVLFGSTPPASGTIAEAPPRAEPHSAGSPALLSDEDVDRLLEATEGAVTRHLATRA